jgi:von Willebrand factor type A domain/Aerotolerance regulator N-terminal
MLGLANPLGLLALASVAVLIALTLLARRTRTTVVSSLLLWKQIPARRIERQRFRPDLLFLLRLLLLLALTAGYAAPYLSRPGGDTAGLAIVLDVSASMQVREAGGRRFDLARRQLDTLVAALPAGAPVLLVTAADRPRVVQRWTTDRARLADRLGAISPLDTPTVLGPAIELALGEVTRHPGARVAVFTDLPPAASGLVPAEVAAVDWTAIGRRDDNVAITSVAVDAPPFAALADVRAEAVLRNFGPRARTVSLQTSIDDTPWLRHAVDLPARAARRVPLGAPPRAGVLHVRLSGDDALAVDDQAVAWVPSQPPLDVLVVTESDAFAAAFRALVATTGQGHVEVVNRAGLAERAGVAGVTGVVTVFDRLAPRDGDAGAALYVAPPPGNAVCPSAREVDDASVVDWEDAHPVLAGLGGLAAIEADRAMQLTTPPWGATIVTAASRRAAYPFLVVGESHGRRRACLAAELPPLPATSDTMPLELLTLSTLRWLAEPLEDAPIVLRTGVPERAPGGAVGGVPGLLAVGDPAVVLAERAGVHRVPTGNGGERLVLANLADDAESDVGRDGGGTWPASTTPAPRPGVAGRADLSWWFYAAAAALLVLEWLAWGIAG